MTKIELIEKALETARNAHDRVMRPSDMDIALKSLCEVATAELLGGGEVPLPGLGKLKVRETSAREGRNPRTGESISIPAGEKVAFAACKELKEALKP